MKTREEIINKIKSIEETQRLMNKYPTNKLKDATKVNSILINILNWVLGENE